MGQNPNPDNQSTTDRYVSHLRENVTGLLAGVIVVSMMGLLIIPFALGYINTKDSVGFANVKDLLSFINPLVGVVIGYYFNKASTEARAESAERTAKQATDAAQNTAQANTAAVQTAVKATEQTSQVTATLTDTQGQLQASQQLAQNAQAAVDATIPNLEAVLQQQPFAAPSPESFNPNDPMARSLGDLAPPLVMVLTDEQRAKLQESLDRLKQFSRSR